MSRCGHCGGVASEGSRCVGCGAPFVPLVAPKIACPEGPHHLGRISIVVKCTKGHQNHLRHAPTISMALIVKVKRVRAFWFFTREEKTYQMPACRTCGETLPRDDRYVSKLREYPCGCFKWVWIDGLEYVDWVIRQRPAARVPECLGKGSK